MSELPRPEQHTRRNIISQLPSNNNNIYSNNNTIYSNSNSNYFSKRQGQGEGEEEEGQEEERKPNHFYPIIPPKSDITNLRKRIIWKNKHRRCKSVLTTYNKYIKTIGKKKNKEEKEKYIGEKKDKLIYIYIHAQ